MVDEPTKGTLYGSVVAAPYVANVMETILPYLGVEPVYTEDELSLDGVGTVVVPNLIGMKKEEAKKLLSAYEFETVYYSGEGELVSEQFPEDLKGRPWKWGQRRMSTLAPPPSAPPSTVVDLRSILWRF